MTQIDYNKIQLPKTSRGRKTEAQQIKYQKELNEFADTLMNLQLDITNKTRWNRINEKEKISARGWCYQLENFNLITKDKFDYCEGLINLCRKEGYLPLDFTAQDKSREFYNVEKLKEEYESPKDYLYNVLNYAIDVEEFKEDIAFWESQKYYIQMTVEKVDVRNIFYDICEKYHIPISNAKGWSDINSRGKLIKRFKEADEIGLIPVLLYYGDFDPAGLKIADTLRKNIIDLEKATKWNPKNLLIDRFGLTIEFIEQNNVLWIDNLITGGKRDLGKLYKQYKEGKEVKVYDYEIEYIKRFGIRKCEANAIIPIKNVAIKNCEEILKKYLGDNPFEIYNKKIEENQKEVLDLMDAIDYKERIQELIDDIENSNQDSN
ncbi:MAG: hypothetical protein ACFFCV_20185 [Promethearchaeota archaeon]